MTYEDFLKIPVAFLKTPKEVFSMEREPQRVFSAEETEFLNHYKRNFQERVDAITLKHLSGELDNPDVLNAVKNKLKTDYNKS
jgi:hypothetical protein